MREGRDAPGLDGSRRRPVRAAAIRRRHAPPARAQVSAKRVIGTADVAARHQGSGEMRAGRQSGIRLHGREQRGARQPQFAQGARRFCACAPGAARLASRACFCSRNEAGSIHSPRTWMAWERQEAEISTPGTSRMPLRPAAALRLLESCNRVVIGERQHLDAGRGRALHQLGRTQGAVGADANGYADRLSRLTMGCPQAPRPPDADPPAR